MPYLLGFHAIHFLNPWSILINLWWLLMLGPEILSNTASAYSYLELTILWLTYFAADRTTGLNFHLSRTQGHNLFDLTLWPCLLTYSGVPNSSPIHFYIFSVIFFPPGHHIMSWMLINFSKFEFWRLFFTSFFYKRFLRPFFNYVLQYFFNFNT